MLTALIIISLLSLLIATEAEPASSPAESANDEPLRPQPPHTTPSKNGNPNRLAA
ncbi:MAG TPA: hypothetical protein VG734_01040 [Lacunisphaera sp.]|nr:hypothetical protein [Lacunisphaera sp.]